MQAVVVNVRKTAAAVSYQNGEVRLYTFPCQEHTGRKYITVKGTATQAHRMAFSSDGRYLIILDSFTRTIMQYTLKPIVDESEL